jgi:rhamnogalacturonyl hydrolase YesR
LSSNYENLKNWISNSELIVSTPNNENYGGVYSFYDENEKKYSFLYPEITGYSASTLSFLYEISPNSKLDELAKANTTWLIKIFQKFDSIVQGISPDKKRQKFAYTFDAAICAKGLLDYYKINNSSELLGTAKSLLTWIVPAINNDGTVLPYKNLESNNFEEDSDVWYRKKGNLHIKISIPFVQMYELTRDESYLNVAKKLCNTYPKYVQRDGSLSMHENTDEINLHTLSYALEGLLFSYASTGSNQYLECCMNCLNWCSKQIDADGSINLWFNSKHSSKSIYPIAQIIRLMLLVDSIDKTNHYSANVKKLTEFMYSLQAKNSDPKINGGFYEEFYKTIFGWKKRKKLNSWGSMFAIQALFWAENPEKIDFKKSIWSLY